MNPFLRACALAICGVILTAPLMSAEKKETAAKEFFVYFGTYTKAKSKGIYRARLDVATGKLSAAELAAECKDPAFLAVHPTGKFLYSIHESSDPAKTPGSGVSAFGIEARTGALTLLNEQSSGGAGPCHLTVDTEGKCVLVANYSGGSVALLPLSADGRLSAAGAVLKHSGSSVHPTRQKQPYAHAINVSPDNRFAFSPDLGADKVFIYRLDAAKHALVPNTPGFATLPAGSGPRHLAFHPDGKFVYVINELLCTMSVFGYDASRGELKELQNVSTLPSGEAVRPAYSTAEVVAHPSGKFLYGSNRGHDSIAVYAIDAASGRLSHVQHEPTQGKAPRNFAIDPTGAWLLAENQNSDTVVVFRIDPQSGRLTATGQSVEVGAPVAAVFVRVL
jgi:6-phosphogluconolactonase